MRAPYHYLTEEAEIAEEKFYTNVVGTLTIRIARLEAVLVKTDKDYKARINTDAIASAKAYNDLRDKLTAASDLAAIHDKRYVEVIEELNFLQSHFPDAHALYLEHKTKPNERELAMAQSKGEFAEAVRRYAQRTGQTDADAKEKLKNALGLTGGSEDSNPSKTKARATKVNNK